MRINTLDLDEIDKEQLQRIITKIEKNLCCIKTEVKPSNSKGYHVKIICRNDCDLCRFVFDDDKRYAIDYVMPLRLRDFLFNEKVHFGKLPTTKENLHKIGEMTI